MVPVLLSRTLDPVLGVFTGILAYKLYETHPRTLRPPNERLVNLLQWKIIQHQRRREEHLNALGQT